MPGKTVQVAAESWGAQRNEGQTCAGMLRVLSCKDLARSSFLLQGYMMALTGLGFHGFSLVAILMMLLKG